MSTKVTQFDPVASLHFVPGLELNSYYFSEVVKPLLDAHFPGLRYAAGVLGEGSDVLGFDTPQSMDHNWGPQVMIFLKPRDFAAHKDAIDQMLRDKLPLEFRGFPTNFTQPDLSQYRVQVMQPITRGPVNHMVRFFTIKSFFKHYLGTNPYRAITNKDWLMYPQQALCEITKGAIFHDDIGLGKVRAKFDYFPENVWPYIYMIQWDKIANEESYMARAGQSGQERGSYIVAARLVRNIMELCFLMEKQYIPYIKWFDKAFMQLPIAVAIGPLLDKVLESHSWQERESYLSAAYELVVRRHNALGVTKPLRTSVQDFNGRPFKVIDAHTAVHETFKAVKDPYFRNLKYKIGSIDQFIDHTRIHHMNYVYKEFRKILK